MKKCQALNKRGKWSKSCELTTSKFKCFDGDIQKVLRKKFGENYEYGTTEHRLYFWRRKKVWYCGECGKEK